MAPNTLTHTDPSGRAWRVVDVVYGVAPATPGRSVRLALGDPRATGRVFLPADGQHVTTRDGVRLYARCALAADGPRDTAPETLAAQLRAVAWWDARPAAEIQRERADVR